MKRIPKSFPFLLIAIVLSFTMIIALFNIIKPVQADISATYHVAKTGDGSDGLTWATAFSDLQDALAVAVSGDEIWVAAGVYTPGTSRDDSFQLINGVDIYGGFVTTETLLSQRDWETNLTILSGDIDGDDETNSSGVVTDPTGIHGDNSEHVVVGSQVFSDTVLDGFSITAGQAGGIFSFEHNGGGMYNFHGSPTLNNINFIGNTAIMTITENKINETSTPSEGKILSVVSGYYWGGGGMYNTGCSPILNNVKFLNNSTDGLGGGMLNWQVSSPSLTNVTFSGNRANYGGGIYNFNSSNPKLTNVTFSGNWSTFSGGGMENYAYSSPILMNVSFSGNSAGSRGGGMYNKDYSNPSLINVTISGNLADEGGGIYNSLYSNPSIFNSILWENEGSSGDGSIIDNVSNITSVITLTHSLLQGSGGSDDWIDSDSYVDGGNNLDEDPLFKIPVDPTGAPTTAGDLRLGSGSPAINTGDNQYVVDIPYDLDGRLRIINDVVDMGAYEYVYIIRVAKTGNGYDGLSWTNAFTNIQDALAVIPAGGEIWIAKGVYTPGLSVDDTFQLLDEVGLYGGFAATENVLPQRDWVDNLTVLSGDISGDDITDPNGVVTDTVNLIGDNSCHVITAIGIDDSAVLDGFTVSGGQAGVHLYPCPVMSGAGMYNDSSSPIVKNVNFAGNAGGTAGGGMANENGSDPLLNNVAFFGNSASTNGGAMWNHQSSPMLINVDFTGNDTSYHGGGISNYESSPILVGVTFSDNFSAGHGGGMWNELNSNPIFTDVIFIGNTAIDSGGGLVNYNNCSSELTNVIFSSNSAENSGGGMWNYDNSTSILRDVTFSGNSAEYGGGMSSDHSSNTTLISATFSENSATGYGGGMYNYWYSDSSLTDVTFTNNSATEFGGGMSNDWYSNPSLTHVTFTGNSAVNGGGGMYNADSDPILTDVTFSGNWADEGGGILNGANNSYLTNVSFSENAAAVNGGGMANWSGNQTLISVTLSGNTADTNGGGIYNAQVLSTYTEVIFTRNSALIDGGGMYNEDTIMTMTNLTISGNWADGYGGGMYNENVKLILLNTIFIENTAGIAGAMNNNISNPTITNAIFSNNSADDKGGGMYNYWSFPILTNVIFSGNSAEFGGGMFNDDISDPKVRNSILWDNQDSTGTGTISATITNDRDSTVYLTYSVVQGSGGSDNWIGGSYTDGGGNIDEDPMFITPPSITRFSPIFNYLLAPGSPAIDAGDNQYVEGIPFDMAGNRRIINGIVDMSAYESFIYLFMPLMVR